MEKEKMSTTTTSRLTLPKLYKQVVMTQTARMLLILYKIKEKVYLKGLTRKYLFPQKKRKTWSSLVSTTSRKCRKNSLDPAWACWD
jgi:hypothetical protein